MRFSFRLTLGARTLASVAFALLLVGLGGGCEEKHIGRPCELGVDATGDNTTITSPALQCPSRLCILPQAQRETRSTKQIEDQKAGTTSLCTATCSSAGDCDGE